MNFTKLRFHDDVMAAILSKKYVELSRPNFAPIFFKFDIQKNLSKNQIEVWIAAFYVKKIKWKWRTENQIVFKKPAKTWNA